MTEPLREKPRLLITGGTGLLAVNWACAVRAEWDVLLGTHRHQVALAGVNSSSVPLDSPAAFGAALDRMRPSLIVHTAGLTDVDRCQAEPALAVACNGELARTVAVAAAARGIALIHISTDHLFTGTRSLVTEDEPPAPMNEYGHSKWRAEQWVMNAHPQALVLRTNFFGWGHAMRQSFSDWILATLSADQPLSAFDDVYFTPTIADRVARWGHALLGLRASGVFHVCGDERVSKYDFACRLATQAGLPLSQIRRASIENAGLRAPRPRDMSLSTTRARQVLGLESRPLEDDLRELFAQEATGRRAELLKAVSR